MSARPVMPVMAAWPAMPAITCGRAMPAGRVGSERGCSAAAEFTSPGVEAASSSPQASKVQPTTLWGWLHFRSAQSPSLRLQTRAV